MTASSIISVGIPTRNRSNHLRQAIESAAASSGVTVEILVSDNASSDETPEMAAHYREKGVRWFRHESDLGMVGNWNFCLKQAAGDYFLLLSDDDLLTPDGLKLLLDGLVAESIDYTPAISYGAVQVIDASDRVLTRGHLGPPLESAADFIVNWLRSRRSIYPCATLFRRPDLLAISGYAERYGPFADVGAYLGVMSLRLEGGVRFVKKCVASYRVHDSNLSGDDQVASYMAAFVAVQKDFESLAGTRGEHSFRVYRASLLASKLRAFAKRRPSPAINYLKLLWRYWPLANEQFAFEPYFRNWLILASPALYESYKMMRAAQRS
jgi:glycosyltransferase involved in cell wall biosynthesis